MAKYVTKKKLKKRIKALEKTVEKQNRQIKLLAVTAFDSPRKRFFAEADNLVTVPVYPEFGEINPCAQDCDDQRKRDIEAAKGNRDLLRKAEEDYTACIGFKCFGIEPDFKA